MSHEGKYGENVFESKVKYACHADFRMIGDPVIKCSDSATWLPEVPPMCEAITCGDLGKHIQVLSASVNWEIYQSCCK